MKASEKILIGLGVTAAVGGTVAYLASEAIIAKFQASKNRRKVRGFVDEKFKGNQKALAFVEKLSDDDVANLLATADKLSGIKDRVGEYAGQAQSTAADYWQTLLELSKRVRN